MAEVIKSQIVGVVESEKYEPLDTLEGFIQRCIKNSAIFGQANLGFEARSIYCPSCGDLRRVSIKCLYYAAQSRGLNLAGDWRTVAAQLTPSLFKLTCVECKTSFTSMVYQGPKGPDVVFLCSHTAGLTTPNTPPAVAYYLDQAYRSESVGARSAAVAMFRGALDHLLFEQGYK